MVLNGVEVRAGALPLIDLFLGLSDATNKRQADCNCFSKSRHLSQDLIIIIALQIDRKGFWGFGVSKLDPAVQS